MTSSARKNRRRWLPWLLAVALLVALGLGLREGPIQVETARVTFAPLQATVSDEGKTRIRQRYVVSSPVHGLLRRVPFKPGAEVEAGTVVARIEPMAASPLDTRSRALAGVRLEAATAALEKARAAHVLARTELERIEHLQRDGTVSPQELDSARLREIAAARDVVTAEGAWRAAEAELRGARAATDPDAPVELTAPVSGRVLRVFEESERPVAAGMPILEVGDPTDLEVVIELLSRDGAALAPGARVLLEQWGGEQPLEARVRLVEPAAFTRISALGVEEQRVFVVADIITPLAERVSLGDNYRVEARVVVWETPATLQAPVAALFRHAGGWAAYALRAGRAVLVPVEVGRSSGRATQILRGLSEGDTVILYPGDRVKPGMRVKARVEE